MKKHLITIPLAILAGLAVAGHAAAHNATATPSCSGLAWSAWNYVKEVVNTITVTVDGNVVHNDPDFKSSDEGTHPWSQTAPHAWSVVVDAPGTTFDRSFAGTWQACQTTTTTPTSTTVVVATTVPTTSTVLETTVPVDTTTTDVEVGQPPVPTTALAVADPVLVPEPGLPRTGVSEVVLYVALIVLGLGGVLAAIAARRRA